MNDEKAAPFFVTWDDALQNGNENERNMAKNGKALLEEVLRYRPLGTVADITQALEESEKLADISIEQSKELIEYRKLGTPDDLRLIIHVARCIAQGDSIETFLINYLDNLKDSLQ